MTEVVRGQVRLASWSVVGRGAYVAARDPCLADRLRAWATHLPGSAAFTHLTAAELRGWWLPADIARPVFVAVSETEPHPQRRGLDVTRLRADPEAEVTDGLRLTTPAQTLLACSDDLHVLDLVPLVDSALRAGHCTLAELWRATRERRRGVRMLRRVLPLVDARSESAWESVLRVLHRTAEVEVEPQHEIVTGQGAFVARADLWLVGTRRIHEYDGAGHRDGPTHRDDLARERRLVADGWVRCGYTAYEVLRRANEVIASADSALGRSWDPRRLEAWRALVRASLHGTDGRTRAAARWRTNR